MPLWFRFILLALSAYRLTRIVTQDDIPPLLWLRDTIEGKIRKRHGLGWSHGIECPWCAGWWISLAVVLVDLYVVAFPVWLLMFLSVSTIVGFIGSHDE